MGLIRQSTFIITRTDKEQEPKAIVRQGLWIGRERNCDIWLNHETVSRLHAGINEIAGLFYLVNFSASSATALNGRIIPFNGIAALSAGDELQIGPYFLGIEETDGALRIRVIRQFALAVGERSPRHNAEAYQRQLAAESRAALSSDVSNSLRIWWDDKRTGIKAGRPSLLRPQAPPRLGKSRFNWKPTRDLVRPWPLAILIWGFLLVGVISAVAAFKYKIAFAPEPLSAAHIRTAPTLVPTIAKQASGGSCTSCHAAEVSVTNKEEMNANCTACHQTDAFAATITHAHREAGLSCSDCHLEHRGKDFRPLDAALGSCTKCHSDENKEIYNGRRVHRAHGGTFGYPVVNGKWIWKGLDPDELLERPKIAGLKLPFDSDIQWTRKQFHALHLYAVKATRGVTGVLDPPSGTVPVLSCSSCHNFNGDKETPGHKCGLCHNGLSDAMGQTLVAINAPNCISCHVQHPKDKRHWNPDMLADKVQQAAGER